MKMYLMKLLVPMQLFWSQPTIPFSMIWILPVSRSNSFLSLFFSILSSSFLSNPTFLLFLEEATCSNCWHKQYATHDPTYTLQFTTISLSNIRRNLSPLQLIRSSNSQTNAVDHILCAQCCRFLSKDTKSKAFADSYPSFLWNLLAGN